MLKRFLTTPLLAVWLTIIPQGATPGAATSAIRLHFVGYSTGLRVLDIQASLALDPAGYDVQIGLRTLGVFSVFVAGSTMTVARGTWRDDDAAPAFFGASGRWRGETLMTRIDYVDGQPKIRALLPDPRREREPVAAALQVNTIDSVSAMAELGRRVDSSGRCDGAARTFDGRRLSEITAHTVGIQMLPRSDLSSFSGPALRCDFEGQLLAGFKFDDDRARAARPKHGTAWLARLTPDGPMLPVRVRFETQFFDDATMYLQP